MYSLSMKRLITKHTQIELVALSESLNLNSEDLSQIFKVPARTIRYWESGLNARGNKVPQRVINKAVAKLNEFQKLIAENVSSHPTDARNLKILFDDELYRSSSEWDAKLPLAALHRTQQLRIKLKLAEHGIDVKLVSEEQE
ncbi:hypothetical protein [Vibrio crassostreae]|uniref:hypothetical protein n=1 Tax=Vibrio crassostreae TaxID=246167 RepID=UPI001B317159|nr:hypothetical protein [Vibrio crassostreae]